MASPLTQRAIERIADSGFTRAKKLADLSVKTNTDAAGNPTSRGYEEAINLLQPFIVSGREKDRLDAQRLVAAYNNNLDKLSKKTRDQAETVAAFKLQELDAYFTSLDGEIGFRNPTTLIDATSEALDNLTFGVLNAIDEKEAVNDSTDALYSYLNELTKRADTMRDLRNRFQNGELVSGQTLEGFGYYVDTNPIDGSIRAAALLPVGLAPDGITTGYRRIDATAKVGESLLPVYAPAQRDAFGDYIARVGDATWSGTGDGALRSDKAEKSKSLFKEGEFNISDASAFPVRKTDIERGAFGAGFAGRDDKGNPVEAVLYRGFDGKLYTVDSATLEGFQKDPVLNQKLNGYVSRFSPTEIRNLIKEAEPFSTERIGREGKVVGIQAEAERAQAEADRLQNLGFFGQLKEGFKILGEEAKQRQETRTTFFERKNIPNKPEEPSTGLEPENIVETGKQFFRKVGGFFGITPQ